MGWGVKEVEKRIKKEHIITGYTDSYANIKSFHGVSFYKLSDINKVEFDYIIITLRNCKISWDIYCMLSNDLNISPDKIIPFWPCSEIELWDIKMKSYDLNSTKGLIFGNSNAAYGFLEESLSIPFINLAVPAQDIYYNYKVYHTCIDKYGNELKNLEYIIIDLYDFNEFNRDISLGKYCVDYIYWGGLNDIHNYKNNCNFKSSLNDEVFKKYGVLLENEKTHIMKQLFEDITARFDMPANNKWKHISKNDPIDGMSITSNVILKRREETVQENIKILNQFLKEIRELNEDMKIIFTLIPKYTVLERVLEPFLKDWKIEFMETVNALREQYQVYFFNYKDYKEISENHMFYYDMGHLNTVGAWAMSEILSQDLLKI